MKTDYQKDYIDYAKQHGKTPEEMIEYDKTKYLGGSMTGYILWKRKGIK